MNRTSLSRVGASTFAVLAVVLTLLTAARTSYARVDGDVRAGVYPNADAVSVGGGVLTTLGSSSAWHFNPNVEVAMGDREDIVAMSGDVHYDFATGRPTAFWMGAGPAVLMTDHAGTGGFETDLGVNVLAGVGAKRGSVRPFGQLRGTMSDQSQVTLAGGIRF